MTSKWKQVLESTKGGVEYNPNQSFSLHVFWIVRSRKAALEMLEHGFLPCSEATARDTPSTLCYFFRISHDQRLAQALKESVKTIGDHPHYQPAFKSLKMGIPLNSVQLKLKAGEIDVTPLTWDPSEPISAHVEELDFDPVVLECTEVYLDNYSFYNHGASNEWMGAYPEIMKASRSLKPTTYCMGNAVEKIWDTILDPMLKAIPVTKADSFVGSNGLFIGNLVSLVGDISMYFEFDIEIESAQSEAVRTHLSGLTEGWVQCVAFILAIPRDNFPSDGRTTIRVIISLLMTIGTIPSTTNLRSLLSLSRVPVSGQLFLHQHQNQPPSAAAGDLVSELDLKTIGSSFLSSIGLSSLLETVVVYVRDDAVLVHHTAAGYGWHPRSRELVANPSFDHQP